MDEGTMHSFLSPERQDCAKKLFEDDSLCWRNTSDYFSQSGDDTCLVTTLSFSSPPPASPHEVSKFQDPSHAPLILIRVAFGKILVIHFLSYKHSFCIVK